MSIKQAATEGADMTTADETALTEQIAGALEARSADALMSISPIEARMLAAAVLPIIREHDARVCRDAARRALNGLAMKFERMGDYADLADQPGSPFWEAQDETEEYRDEFYPAETP